mgnify:CR=1 FL=1
MTTNLDNLTEQQSELLRQSNNDNQICIRFVRRGKVREVIDINSHMIGLIHTDRLSSFDRHICNVPGKGNLLLQTSLFWMNKTRHIVPNHVLMHHKNLLLCKKCKTIPLEIVVRGYITGSTQTSLWTHYNNGERTYCGIDFPDGLVKNQKLSSPVITPTTKDEHDEPLSAQQIVERGILNQLELNYISRVALRLFNYGQQVAASKGLILVDTKYEFGYDSQGVITLIDEIHTCDSSRYWKASTYQERFEGGLEPEKLDKDAARDYVKTICDPYTVDVIPEIPSERIDSVYQCYSNLYYTLTNSNLERLPYNSSDYIEIPDSVNQHPNYTNFILTPNKSEMCQFLEFYYNFVQPNLVVILSGSEKDASHVNKIKKYLRENNIYYQSHIASAHKSTRALLDILQTYSMSIQQSRAKYRLNPERQRRIIYVTVAGRSNALSGVVACNAKECAVIACPPFKDKMDMMVNIHSTLQMPSNVPVMTVLEPVNVALACRRILNV